MSLYVFVKNVKIIKIRIRLARVHLVSFILVYIANFSFHSFPDISRHQLNIAVPILDLPTLYVESCHVSPLPLAEMHYTQFSMKPFSGSDCFLKTNFGL